LAGVSVINSQMVKVTYTGGDLAEDAPRQVDIYISCNSSAGILDFYNFTIPYPQNPPPPYYLYQLYLQSSSLCAGSGKSQCPLVPGFSFGGIAALNNYQTTWTVNGQTEMLSYAPCSSGIPTPCGTQCANQASCCAVCQSVGFETMCLGMSSKLIGVTVMNPVSVKISYGGGDFFQNSTPSQVDITINCDPAAGQLTFVKFIEPTPSNPPPSVYIFQLFLSSATLCSSPISDFLATIGIEYP